VYLLEYTKTTSVKYILNLPTTISILSRWWRF